MTIPVVVPVTIQDGDSDTVLPRTLLEVLPRLQALGGGEASEGHLGGGLLLLRRQPGAAC